MQRHFELFQAEANPSDPHVYYIFRYPMTCGELCFNGLGCGICEDGGDEGEY